MSILATRRLTLCVLALLLPAGLRAQATAHPFLWRVEGKAGAEPGKPCWLYGTMHLGDERLVTLPEPVEQARDSADALYCELALDRRSTSKLQTEMVKRMLLPRGEELRDHLPPDLYRRLADFLERRNVPIRVCERMHVWGVTLTLATVDVPKLGYNKSLDQILYREAEDAGKEVGGIEQMEEQIGAFTGGREADHVVMLRQTLDHMEKLEKQGKSALAEMLEIYLKGDVGLLLEHVDESLGEDREVAERLMKPLLDDRNVRMAERMDERMAGNPGKSYFFAVGAMHYPGEKGVLALLRAKGWRITRIGEPRTIEELQHEIVDLRRKLRQRQPRPVWL